MAKIDAASIAVLCLILVSTWVPTAVGVKKPASAARKEDVPFIKCQVCEKLASQLYRQVQKKQAQISPKKISEYEVIEIAENICNLKKEEADWILKIDVVEQGDKLELVDQDTEGICNSECKTIERACQEIMGYSDTDVAEYIYNSKPQIDSLVDFLCKDLSRACSSMPPPLPKGRTPGEAFMPKPAKDAEMEKILRSMEGMPGAPSMKMYSRDELMNKNFGEEDDDEEDEDEDAHFPSKLGKVLREKESRKGDWKQKLTEGIKTTGEVLKRHADKVSLRLRKWWRGVRSPDSKKNSKTGKSEL
ncbi:uncharacterized protein LOC115740706 [Rhodamnia argentea]|uniref:Uncharacterized protein LOC115740706 n=1 Tax=Rhodamnia argentea TaxID=178133 RepID=A0A8B8P5K4_9MYRT|nr:uncharacterized protein LOC115740706 [Rhodamnia argentea]